MKRILAILMTVLLICSLSVMSYADGTSTGKITIKNTSPGENYTAYKVFDLSYAEDIEKEDGQVTSPVSYTYTKTGESDALFTALTGDTSPFDLEQIGTSNVYNVTLAEEADISDITDFFATLVPEEGDALLPVVGAATPATGSTVVFEGVGYGYFYIATSSGALVTIDSTIPDVTVVDKNIADPTWDNGEDPSDPNTPGPGKVIVEYSVGEDEKPIETKMTENSVNYGDTVHFNIAVNARAWVKNSEDEIQLVTYYYLTDTLDAGFVPNNDIEVKVYKLGEDGTYDLEHPVVLDNTTCTLVQNGNTFDLTVPFGEKYGTKAKIEVSYSAKINATGENVVLGPDGNYNKANYTYSAKTVDPDDPTVPTVPGTPSYPTPDPDPTYSKEPQVTKTTVYALGIQKVDKENNPLAGAKFSIAGIQAEKEDDGVYRFTAVTPADGKDTEFATDDNGVLVVKGVKQGQYSVTETVAPDGYNKLTAPVSIDASPTATTTTTVTRYYINGELVETVTTSETEGSDETEGTEEEKAIPVYVIDIINLTGVELPSTGGFGTTLFIAIGSVLFMLTMIILVSKKRAYNAG